jgi:transposase
VGIDVSKEFLDIARSDQPNPWRCANDKAGIRKLVTALSSPTPRCIVIESTGGLERPLIDALLDAELPVALVNPSNVRHLAKGLGFLAKTDAIDARVLARFAELAAPRLLEKRSATRTEFEALVACRRELVNSRIEHLNRLGTTSNKLAQKALRAVLATLDKQIAKLEKQIRNHIDSDDQWKHLDDILQSAPGAGEATAATLLAELPELGKASNREITALAGLAPMNRDSGRFQGKRSIQGGRANLRTALFMPTVAAMRCNPLIKAFADRLTKAGKPWKVVVTACMRKFLILLNVMVRENLKWNQLNLVKNA